MKILLADDHQLFLDGLCSILRQMDEAMELTCVRTGYEALARLEAARFDIALVDLRLPGRDGFELLHRLRHINCLTPVIIVTASEDPDDRRRALDAGAMGFVSKSASCRQIIEAIEAALRGDTADALPDEMNRAHRDWARMHNITPRQLQVLRLMRQGMSNQEIAGRLTLRLATVKSHVAALFKSFDARSRTETVEKARRLGLE